ncbi:MAG: TetR/AcrR family transcriptional regulator [Tatlockia sp.]|nr:TetR/AcrR family transcriptional regulator [Tatlockia sp.]
MTKKETTKEKILAAAKTLFVTHGFAGTSVGNIAKEADVNHSLVFHHFKNKEQLWVAVKQSIVHEADQQALRLPDCHLPFDEFLRKAFLRTLRFYRANRDIVRMLNWQRLEHDSGYAIGVTKSGEMQRWVDAFSHYQKHGYVQSSLKPEFIVTMFLSIISSAALDPNIYIQEKQALEDYIDFCITTLTSGLK